MSSLEERLEAAMCEDSTIAIPAQHELVRALLRRDAKPEADGSLPAGFGVPSEQRCRHCHWDLDEERYCGFCGEVGEL